MLEQELQAKIDTGKWIDPQKLKTGEPYKSAQRFDPARIPSIIELIENQQGFDIAQPIVVDLNTGLVVDGHHRLAAAIKMKIDVYVIYKYFDTLKDGLRYIGKHQDSRRINDDKERFYFVLNLYTNKNYTDLGIVCSREQKPKKSEIHKLIGEITGYSRPTISKTWKVVKQIIDKQREDIKKQIVNGELSLDQAYKDLNKKQKKGSKKKSINIDVTPEDNGHFYLKREGAEEIDLGYTRVNLIYTLTNTKFKKLQREIAEVYARSLKTAKLKPANKE